MEEKKKSPSPSPVKGAQPAAPSPKSSQPSSLPPTRSPKGSNADANAPPSPRKSPQQSPQSPDSPGSSSPNSLPVPFKDEDDESSFYDDETSADEKSQSNCLEQQQGGQAGSASPSSSPGSSPRKMGVVGRIKKAVASKAMGTRVGRHAILTLVGEAGERIVDDLKATITKYDGLEKARKLKSNALRLAVKVKCLFDAKILTRQNTKHANR